MNGLDLFSGIGGLTLALKPWVRPIAYCENDRYSQAVLLSRMRDRQLPAAPIWDDVRTLQGESLGNWVDIVYGGFPCQDISVAGRGEGLGGERSGLFFEIIRIIKEVRPAFVFLENVPAIRTRGLGRVVSGLAGLGYDCRWTTVSAAEVGAVHIRKRWFLLAHTNCLRLREKQRTKFEKSAEESGSLEPYGSGKAQQSAGTSARPPPPRVDRAGDDVPNRMDRHHGLGNAVVPIQAREAFKKLGGIT